MELAHHDSRIIKTDKNYKHLSSETPSQGKIAQAPQCVSNMHFSTRTLKTLTNSENDNWRPGCSKLYVYHTIIIIPQPIPLKINSEGEQLSKLRTLILGQKPAKLFFSSAQMAGPMSHHCLTKHRGRGTF